MAKSERYVPIRDHQARPVPRGCEREHAKMSVRAEVTIVVRSKGSGDAWRRQVAESIGGLPRERKYLTRAEFGKAWGASRADLEAVRAWGKEHGLATVTSDAWRRCVVLSGTVRQLQKAFGVEMDVVRHPERTFLTYRGVPKVDVSIHPMVETVLGLDTRPASHNDLVLLHPSNAPAQLGLPQLRKVYDFPPDAGGTGQCVAVIELGGGFRRSDYLRYFARIGAAPPQLKVRTLPGATNDPAPAALIRKLVAETLSGGTFPPMTPQTLNALWTCETAMDLQIVGTLAPKAKLLLVFGTDDAQGQYHAITSVLADARNAATVLSCSWGAAENQQMPAAMRALDSWFQAAAVLGVTVCYSSGDAGDGTLGQTGDDLTFTANFPASSPYVLACGGTTLGVEAGTEIAWHEQGMAGGGGFSAVFERPPWQHSARISSTKWIPPGASGGTGRGVPDVSAKANFDPAFSYLTAGVETPTGGTSAAAPLWAALMAVMNEALQCPIGLLDPLLYAGGLSRSLRDITRGNIGHLKAKAGWDPATGWGSPHGEAILEALGGR